MHSRYGTNQASLNMIGKAKFGEPTDGSYGHAQCIKITTSLFASQRGSNRRQSENTKVAVKMAMEAEIFRKA